MLCSLWSFLWLYVPRFSDTAPELFVDIALSARCDIFEDRDYVSLFSWLSPCLAGIWTVKCCILSKWMKVKFLPNIYLLVHSSTSKSTFFSSGVDYHYVICKAHRLQKGASVKLSIRMIFTISNSWLNKNNKRFIITPKKISGCQGAPGSGDSAAQWSGQGPKVFPPFALPSSTCQWFSLLGSEGVIPSKEERYFLS